MSLPARGQVLSVTALTFALLISAPLVTGHAQEAAAVPASPAPRLGMVPIQPWKPNAALFYPPGDVLVSVWLENSSLDASVRWSARDYEGKIIAQGTAPVRSSTARLQDESRRQDIILITVKRPGIVYVTATALGADGKELAQGETRFAIMEPSKVPQAMNAEPLPILYGACAHLGGKGDSDLEREVATISAIGFRACRFDYNWNAVQPQRDVWKWDTFDRIFGLLDTYRIEPLPIVAYTARWATTGDPNAPDWHAWHNAPPVAEDYARFASESARHYSRTHFWELWNEPDIAFWLGTPEQYATVFDAANRAIKAARPDAVVMNGGFSETKRRPAFIPTWMRSVKTRPDILAYHSHNAFGNMVRAADDVRNYKTQANWTMPIWLNEAGFSSSGRQTERDQANALVKKMSSAPALGFSGYFLYDIRNDGTDPNEGEHNFGLVRQDFTPKASAVAVHTLLASLDGQKFVRRMALPGLPQAWALLYERPDHTAGTLVCWNEAKETVPLLLGIPGPTRQVSLMGESQALPVKSGLVSTSLAPEPQIVRFSGSAAQVRVADRLLQLPPSVTMGPGEAAPLLVTVKNPLGTPLRGTLTLKAGGGWKAHTASFTVTVPAHGTKQFRTSLLAPQSAEKAQLLDATLFSNALPSSARARVTLVPALVISRSSQAPTRGDFTNRTTPNRTLGRANTVSLFEATPMQELHFHGDDDLSAKLYLSRVPEGLSVGVRVRDDVHAQNEAAGMEWKGDSVQLALALPTGEHYEWVLALTRNGPVAFLTLSPEAGTTGKLLSYPLAIRREGNETVYDVVLPGTLPGSKTLPNNFSFSALVNDSDGQERKGWVEMTPGIGQSKDPSQFQPIIVR